MTRESPVQGAVVLGGLGAIGSSVCRALTKRKVSVVAVDKRRPGAGDPPTVCADLGIRGEATKAIRAARQQFGPSGLLVNCAGIYPASTLDDFSWSMFDLVLQINLASAIEACLAWMEMKGPNIPGRIVNVASAAGIRGSQDLAYTASKAGLIAVTRSLARAFAPQRTAVFSVAPGIVDTPMAAAMSDDRRQATVSRTIAQREATPSEVAALIVFLLTDQSDYMTGSVVTIDGGLTP